MGKKVAIFGGGMAGLAAAHELIHRGYAVDVYEAGATFGGKSASQVLLPAVPPVAGANPDPLPGEHGFRFFPGFYRHVIATMKEIPNVDLVSGRKWVADYLEPSLNGAVAYPGEPLLPFPRRVTFDSWDVLGKVTALYGTLGFQPEDLARMAWFRLKYLSSGPLRRAGEYDAISWWQFIEGDSPRYSDRFRKFEESIPRTMSAMVAKTSSAKVIGDITAQMILGYFRPNENPDRVLVGPTTKRWIAPWQVYLAQQGVNLISGQKLTKLSYDTTAKEIGGAEVTDTATAAVTTVKADAYLVALPIEVVCKLIDKPLADADPQLKVLRELLNDNFDQWQGWMSGAQFYLKTDEAMVDGHVFYPESKWALTSVSQGQFWEKAGHPIDQSFGDGSVKGILSVDISDWDTKSTPRPPLPARRAKDCKSPGEVLDEVLAQLRDALGNPSFLQDSQIAYRHLDANIEFPPNLPVNNRSPLLIHPIGGLAKRPDAHNAIPNLFLASDYVKTKTELATMEGANEAARMAVNAILDHDGSPHVRCALYDLQEEPFFDVLKEIDDLRFLQGRPHLMDDYPMNLLLDATALLGMAQEFLKSAAGVLATL